MICIYETYSSECKDHNSLFVFRPWLKNVYVQLALHLLPKPVALYYCTIPQEKRIKTILKFRISKVVDKSPLKILDRFRTRTSRGHEIAWYGVDWVIFTSCFDDNVDVGKFRTWIVRLNVMPKTRVVFVRIFYVNRHLQAKHLSEIIVLYNFVL